MTAMDYNIMGLGGTRESTVILKKREREREKHEVQGKVFIEACQLIIEEGMIELENHH